MGSALDIDLVGAFAPRYIPRPVLPSPILAANNTNRRISQRGAGSLGAIAS
jgi:hypothetical protein